MDLIPTLVFASLLTVVAVALGITWQRAASLQERLNETTASLGNRIDLEAQLRELRRREEALEALSEAAYSALLLVDSEHRVVHVNATARELFKHGSNRPPVGQQESVMSLTRQHDLDDLVAAALQQADEPIHHQVMIQGRPYQVRAECIEAAGTPYVVVALEDVGELQRLGRARRDMVANVSHELRTPITSIRLLVDTLLRGAIQEPAQAEPLVQKIAVETDNLHQMARELLDLSMIESGRAEFILRPINLHEIAAEAIQRMAELAQRQRHTVENRVGEGVLVLADREQIARVLTNLLHNAMKFTPPGGRIEVGGTPEGEWVTVMVTDNGPGVPIAERERIFERFYRSDRARGGGGTGLGLAIAKHIVEAHGGRIWAGEPPVSHLGAHICFTLPTPER